VYECLPKKENTRMCDKGCTLKLVRQLMEANFTNVRLFIAPKESPQNTH
jgi:hypothetical protein